MRTRTRAWTDRILYHSARSMIGRSLILGILSFVLSILTPAGAAPIRVLLLQNLPTFSISVPPDYTILTQPAGLLPADVNHWRVFQAQASTRNIRIPEPGIEVDELRLVPRTKDAVIYAGSKMYRGSLEVKWGAPGLMVVNTLDIEEYLYGVVAKEAPSQWEMAALRAQAIVARTYALYKRTQQANRDYDVDRKSTRLNSSHLVISYAVFCLKKKTNKE